MADLIHQGATGAYGNTCEPFGGYCVRPDDLFPAYFEGRNLAESRYIVIVAEPGGRGAWRSAVLAG